MLSVQMDLDFECSLKRRIVKWRDIFVCKGVILFHVKQVLRLLISLFVCLALNCGRFT